MVARTRRIRAAKRLGQHFLVDPVAAGRIVEAARVGANDLVVEIGPGRGALTGPLLEVASRVVGIELDPVLCALLQQACGHRGDLSVLNCDVLKVNFPELVQSEGFARAVLVGNLPYQVTGAVVEQILDARAVLTRAVLTVQREVARRMTALPGGKDYGVLSIAVQLRTRPEWLFDLPPEHFSPVPRVHSSALRLDFTSEPPVRVEDERVFFRVVRTAFQQRMFRSGGRPAPASGSHLDGAVRTDLPWAGCLFTGQGLRQPIYARDERCLLCRRPRRSGLTGNS